MTDLNLPNWKIYGHNWAVNLLSQHILRGETHHAYLLTGSDGIGKRSLALRFAQALNCPSPIETSIPCGVCRICTQTWAMKQADLSVIQTENEQGEPEENGVIKVEQIRTLQHSLSLSPFEAKYRIALIIKFQQANQNAQNALLKTLEEAPEKSIILLTADSAESLLPTIASRCEILRLRPMPIDQTQKILNTAFNIDSEQARQLAHLTRGQLGKAIQLSSNPAVIEKRQDLIATLIELLSSNYCKRFEFAEDITKKPKDRISVKKNLRFALEVWLTVWRDIILQTSESSVPLVNIDHQHVIKQMSESVSFSTSFQVTKRIQECLTKLDSTNLNLQLQVESLMLDLPRITISNQ